MLSLSIKYIYFILILYSVLSNTWLQQEQVLIGFFFSSTGVVALLLQLYLSLGFLVLPLIAFDRFPLTLLLWRDQKPDVYWAWSWEQLILGGKKSLLFHFCDSFSLAFKVTAIMNLLHLISPNFHCLTQVTVNFEGVPIPLFSSRAPLYNNILFIIARLPKITLELMAQAPLVSSPRTWAVARALPTHQLCPYPTWLRFKLFFSGGFWHFRLYFAHSGWFCPF